MVSKGKIPLAVVTNGWKAVIIDAIRLTLKKEHSTMNVANLSQFHLSLFKLESHNPKFNLEYLATTKEDGKKSGSL